VFPSSIPRLLDEIPIVVFVVLVFFRFDVGREASVESWDS